MRLHEPSPANSVPDSPYDKVIVPKPRGAALANPLVFGSAFALYVVVVDVGSVFGGTTEGLMLFAGAGLLFGGGRWLRNRVSLGAALVILALSVFAAIYDVNNVGRLADWHWARTEHPKKP